MGLNFQVTNYYNANFNAGAGDPLDAGNNFPNVDLIYSDLQ